jgi:hypothetical protein
MVVNTSTQQSGVSRYVSVELQQIQEQSTSPFGMLFFSVPLSPVSLPENEKATTRTCDETSNDGSSKLDCIDDDD